MMCLHISHFGKCSENSYDYKGQYKSLHRHSSCFKRENLFSKHFFQEIANNFSINISVNINLKGQKILMDKHTEEINFSTDYIFST